MSYLLTASSLHHVFVDIPRLKHASQLPILAHSKSALISATISADGAFEYIAAIELHVSQRALD
jgi:hypothetical protein